MGQRILIMGASGTGKSASLRNFGADEIKLIKIINKPLPFRGKFNDVLVSDKVSEIVRAIKNTDKKIIVIDDCQYVMGNEFFRRALEKGYDKFSEIGQNFFNLLAVVDEIPDDVFVYYLSHTETDVNGNEKLKTIGKMLDEKLTVEGYFTVVLKTVCADGVYSFQTQNNGHDTVKSPMGMFSGYLIENDLKVVDGVAREYWDFSDQVVEQHVVSSEKPTRKSRSQASSESTRPARKTRAEQLASSPNVEEVEVKTVEDIKVQVAAEEEVVNAPIEVDENTGEVVEEVKEELPRRKAREVKTPLEDKVNEFKARVEARRNPLTMTEEEISREIQERQERKKAEVVEESAPVRRTRTRVRGA